MNGRTMNVFKHNEKQSPYTKPINWAKLTVALLVFWVILVEMQLGGWWYAILVVGFALFVRNVMPIPLALDHISLPALFLFIPRFIWHSLIGGADVAWRAFHPGMPIQPAIYMYPFRLKTEGARVFLAQVISLMPGTLACCVGPQFLVVHVLRGSREAFVKETEELEHRTARVFRERLEEPSHG